jgi:ketosteroid isomerase-like protein
MAQRELVEARLNTWTRVINNKATDSLFALYHQGDSLRVMWPNGRRTIGWEATRQAWRDFYGQTDYMNFVVQSPTVEILSPTVAVATFRHSTDIVRGGRRQPVRPGYGTVIWKKDADGNWKIYISQVAFEVAD